MYSNAFSPPPLFKQIPTILSSLLLLHIFSVFFFCFLLIISQPFNFLFYYSFIETLCHDTINIIPYFSMLYLFENIVYSCFFPEKNDFKCLLPAQKFYVMVLKISFLNFLHFFISPSCITVFFIIKNGVNL